jgi:hypothetical protein
MDVAAWLHGLGLEQYAQLFRDNDIDGEILRGMTPEDLKELGSGDRRRVPPRRAVIAAGRQSELARSRQSCWYRNHMAKAAVALQLTDRAVEGKHRRSRHESTN